MQLVTRAEWGARPRGKGAATPFEPRGCTLHWDGAGWAWPWAHSTCDDKVRGIQAYHMDGRGWSDIAYNFLTCPHGYVFEGRGLNRRSAANGDATVNTYWYAVQCMWGTKSGSAPETLLTAARDAIDYCRTQGGAGTELRGHRDMQQTDCPGDQLYAWVRNGAPRPRPVPPPPTELDWFDMATEADLKKVVEDVVGARLTDLATKIDAVPTAEENRKEFWYGVPVTDKQSGAVAKDFMSWLQEYVRRDTARAASYSAQTLTILGGLDVDKLASAIAAKLPNDHAVDVATVVAGVREALGSLDEQS